MKTSAFSILAALSLLGIGFAVPTSPPERRQTSVGDLGGLIDYDSLTDLLGDSSSLSRLTGRATTSSGIDLPELSDDTDSSTTSSSSSSTADTSDLESLSSVEAQSAAVSSTENDVVDNAGCTDLTVIFARGTSELGNLGSIAGPPMLSALEDSLGTITIQGVDYPASIIGNLNYGADGGPTMKSLVDQALEQCPDSPIVLSGYSQGAMVVHNAATQSGFQADAVVAVVLFGDPLNGDEIEGIDSSIVKEICASGDLVCEANSFLVTAAHLTYGSYADEAAEFIIDTAGL